MSEEQGVYRLPQYTTHFHAFQRECMIPGCSLCHLIVGGDSLGQLLSVIKRSKLVIFFFTQTVTNSSFISGIHYM